MQIKNLSFFYIITVILTVCFVPAVQAAPGDCSAPSFNTAPNFGTEKNPNGVATGDFNNDGKTDLAVANYGSHSFSIFDGDGEGAFAPPRSFPVGIVAIGLGSTPRDVEVSDFNGDGKLDLVVTGGYGTGWVALLLGDGAGGFGAPATYSTGIPAYAAAIGDFNGDGKKDVATVSGLDKKVSFLLGDGAGGLGLMGNFSVTTEPISITAGDFNGDNFTDVAVTGSGSPSFVSIILGNATGDYREVSTMPAPLSPISITSADFNGDNKLDLAVSYSWSTPRHGVSIMLGTGAGTFGAGTEIFTGYEPSAVMAGDFNGDGKSDLAVTVNGTTVSGSNAVAVLSGNGNGGFATPKYFGTAIGPTSLARGDFNNDGKTDIVSTHFYADAISVLIGDGAGSFASSITELSGGGWLASGDFNSDGKPDLAIPVSNSFVSPPLIEIRFNNGAGGLASPLYLQVSHTPHSVIVDDLNHDGKADLVVGHEFSNGLSVLLGNGAGGFSAPMSIAAPSGGGLIIGGDFNGDNNLDLAMFSGGNSAGNIAVMLGNGTGGFGGPSYFVAEGPGTSLTTADLNGDGKLDLAVGNSFIGTVTVLLGVGNGGFTAAPYSPLRAASKTDYVTTGDLNKDGKIDLITANLEPNSVSVLFNNGSGFQPAVTLNAGKGPKLVKVADFNADGNPDLVVALSSIPVQNYAGNISILSGDGAGNFSSPTFFTAGGSPNDLIVTDFNSDGKHDLAVAGTPTSSFNTTLLLNTFKFQPCLSVEDVQVNEGNAGTSNLVFTVNLSASQSQPVKVNYFLKENTAKSGLDYQLVSGRLVFAPGVTQQTITVPIVGDALDEFDEDFSLSLSNPANAAISKGQATGTILDDDPEPTISIDDVSSAEGNFGGLNKAVFSITLSAPSTKQISISYVIVEGTASASNDYYIAAFNPIVIPVGTTKINLFVGYSGDTTYETDETFFVNLSNPVNATIARGQGKGTILNDDPVPTISIEHGYSQAEGIVPNYVSFYVRLSNPSYLPISFNYSTADGTAVAGSDYVAATGTLTVNPGETNQSVDVLVIDDNVDEVNETLFVNLSNPVNASITTAQAEGAISDDDGPTIAINDVTVTEGNAGTVDAIFTVTLSAASPQNVYVNYVTSPITATSNIDYRRSNLAMLTIPAGTTSSTVTIKVIGDSQVEPDETFYVLLSEPVNATIGDGQGIGTIINDDFPPLQLSASSYTVGESGGSVQVVVNRNDSTSAATVNYATSDASGLNACNSVTAIASSRCDYATSIGTLRFAAGESSKTIFIPIVDDNITDGNETFNITLSNPSGATLGSTTSAVVTITDNANTAGNPIDQAEFFIRQHYIDFLGREPEPAGLAGWLNVYNNCGGSVPQPCDRIEISSAFFRSEEFQTRASFVYRFYSAVGKIPLYETFMPDFAKVSGFLSAQELEANKVAFVQEFMTRSDYQTLYGSITGNDAYVTALLNTLGLPNHARKTEWINSLNGGTTRAVVLRSVTEDGQVSQKYYNEAFVIMQYFGYLRRSADISYQQWIALMNSNGGDYRQMIDGFLNSAEYRNRFGN